MPRRFRHLLILGMLLASAVPPPTMSKLLIESVGRASSGAAEGKGPARSNRPTQARGRSRVNTPARPDACLSCLRLAGEEGPRPPSAPLLGPMPPRRMRLRAAGPIPFLPTSHRLRC